VGESNLSDGSGERGIFCKGTDWSSTGVDTTRGKPQLRNMAFDREQMKKMAAALAASGVFVGTSSWKYEGWFGQLYTPARYEYRGKVAKTRFERDSCHSCFPFPFSSAFLYL
jgi:hypothetical protein